jgi:kanamycin kinase
MDLNYDCVAKKYIDYPKKLCDVIAEELYNLHQLDYKDCPIQNHTELYLKSAKVNYQKGKFSQTDLPNNWRITSTKQAYDVVANVEVFG